MKYIESPNPYDGSEKSLFLAGGISGCPDWQADAARMLAETSLVLLNPRRKDFLIDDPSQADFQIQWEYEHLRKASAILFWFPRETLCPITLYELGAWSMTKKPLFVGVHPAYARRRDVEIQTQLVRPDVVIACSLEELIAQMVSFFRGENMAFRF